MHHFVLHCSCYCGWLLEPETLSPASFWLPKMISLCQRLASVSLSLPLSIEDSCVRVLSPPSIFTQSPPRFHTHIHPRTVPPPLTHPTPKWGSGEVDRHANVCFCVDAPALVCKHSTGICMRITSRHLMCVQKILSRCT